MAEGLSRDQAKERLEVIFSSSLEGEELDKALASIDKRLDKFEGKWDGLIKWAETKYGSPEDSQEEPQQEEETHEEKPKKRGMFGFGKSKGSEDTQEPQEETQEQTVEEGGSAPEDTQTGEITREEATERLESIFNSSLEGEELEKAISTIPQRLDKFEGKWPKLILWAEEKYESTPVAETQSEPEDHAQSEPEDEMEKTLELIISGSSDEALSNLKKMISENPANADAWMGMASLFSSMGMLGRSKACEEKAEALA